MTQADADEGSAIAEYTMVLALAVLIFAAIVQLGFALHIRNTLIDAAASGARYASLADRSDDDGVQRAREIISRAVGPRYAREVTITRTEVGDLPTVEVSVVAPLPVVATLGPSQALKVSGHAVAMD